MFINYLLRFIFISIWASSDFEEVDIAVFGFVTALDVTVYMDIIKNFFTGYYDAENNLTVLKPRLIALRYLKFYFWVDFLSVVSVFAYPIVILSGLSETIRMLGQVARCLKLIMILRGPRWSFSMELFRQYMNLSSYLFKATKSFLTYIMVMCWLYTVMITLENIIHQYVYHKNVNPYKIRRYFSVTLVLLLVSYGADPITEVIDAVIATFFICVGFCMQMYLYAQILQVWNKFASARNKNEDLFRQFKEYMKYKGLPMHLRERVFTFFNFRFHNEFANEAQINRLISENLRQEVLLHVTKVHIQRVELFSTLPEEVLQRVVAKLRSEIYLPDDIVVEAGTTGNCMFFIHFGTVAIYTRTGREICHLQDGAHFGEIALVFNETRIATVVAVTACELFKLKRTDFFEVIEPYPEQKQKIIHMALERLLNTDRD
nr:unnamed protein product [Callosobruchus analis]